MRYVRVVVRTGCLVLVAATVLVGTSASRSTAATAVSIMNFSFSPNPVSAAAGAAVTWTNNEATAIPHTVTADDGSFDSGRLTPGQSFTMTFSRAGATIAYHCSIHPSMHGSVTVAGTAAPAMAAVTAAASSVATAAPISASQPAVTSGSTAGQVVALHAGFNLVGVPSGTMLAGTVYEYDPKTGMYAQVDASGALDGGEGYWAFVPGDSSVTLSAGSNAAATIVASPNVYYLIGNPSGGIPALVTGADAVFVYDAASGMYRTTTFLQPGQGAWAISIAGASIVVTPGGMPPMASATATPRPAATATAAPAPTTVATIIPTIVPTVVPTTVPRPGY